MGDDDGVFVVVYENGRRQRGSLCYAGAMGIDARRDDVAPCVFCFDCLGRVNAEGRERAETTAAGRRMVGYRVAEVAG